MNNRLISAAAVALTLVAGSAMADTLSAGADGPSTPSLVAAQGPGLSRAQVNAELAQAQANYQRNRFASADGANGVPQYRVVTAASGLSRTQVRAELAQAQAEQNQHDLFVTADGSYIGGEPAVDSGTSRTALRDLALHVGAADQGSTQN